MSKKITDENGNTYVQKKPFYKKVWFWVLVVIIAGVAAGANGSGKTDNSSNKNESKTEKSASKKSSKSYQEILDEYSEKLKAATPGLIEEYNKEAASNTDGVEGLAKLSNKKVEKLAKISNEGVEEMAAVHLSSGSGKKDAYSEYEDWAGKLQDVYMEEAGKITDAYTNSAMN